MKRIFKWAVRLFLLAVVLLVILVLSLDMILRVLIEHNIRAQTGMDAEIGKFHLGLTQPTVTIRDLKIYNTAAFGGTLFLDIPEIHAEYDRAALSKNELHIKLMRFNLGEVDIVKNQAGLTNIFSMGVPVRAKKPGDGNGGGKVVVDFKKQSGFEFTGIDTLTVSFGKVKFIDLKDQQNNREQDFGVEDCVTPNVKSKTDLGPLIAIIVLHSDGFFDSLMDEKKPGFDILKQLGL